MNWETIRHGLPATPSDTTLTPADINQLLCDANVSRIVLGPDSIPLDVGRATRTPSKATATRGRGTRPGMPVPRM